MPALKIQTLNNCFNPVKFVLLHNCFAVLIFYYFIYFFTTYFFLLSLFPVPTTTSTLTPSLLHLLLLYSEKGRPPMDINQTRHINLKARQGDPV